MTTRNFPRMAAAILALCAAFIGSSSPAADARSTRPGAVPPGFSSANVQVNGSRLHYVRGGRGPAIVLIHGFPLDWVEYQAIMPRLAEHFTVIAVDLPGVGRSAPSATGYDTVSMATHIHDLMEALHLERPYVVGHDVGGHVTYAYVRRFPDSLRGAMILDTPVPGVDGWDQATAGAWHVGFIQTPGLAEKLVPGRQDAFLGWFLDLGKFTPQERAHYIKAYGEPQLHAAFEMYRALPRDGEWNATQNAPNSVPLVVAVGEKFVFTPLLPTFVKGYSARGMTNVRSARIPDAGHYVLADNPEAVADLIEQHAAGR